jgi:hypothetical protein
MRGRQKGRPTKYVKASVVEPVWLGKAGIQFEVWEKWEKKRRKLGTMIVSVGGIRWKPINGKISKRFPWADISDFFKEKPENV